MPAVYKLNFTAPNCISSFTSDDEAIITRGAPPEVEAPSTYFANFLTFVKTLQAEVGVVQLEQSGRSSSIPASIQTGAPPFPRVAVDHDPDCLFHSRAELDHGPHRSGAPLHRHAHHHLRFLREGIGS